MLVCRGGFGAALREPYAVLEHLYLAPYVRRVLVSLSAYVRAASSYVGDQSLVFEGSGRAHQGQHAFVLEPGRRGCEPCHLRSELWGDRDGPDRILLEVL